MSRMRMSRFNEDELIERATAAWLRWCRRNGHLEDQPSVGMSEYRDGVVTLKNVRGPLATYAVAANGRLKLLEDAAHAAG